MTLNYDFVDMKLFSAVADERNVTRGATRVFLSAPAASIRLRNLEQSLGVKLFERKPGGVELTHAGHTFLKHATEILNQSESLSANMREYANGNKGVFRVLLNTSAIAGLPPDLINCFLLDHPDVNIELREDLSVHIVQQLSEGLADIGIVADNVHVDALETLPYQTQRLVLIASPSHPLARSEGIRLKNLGNVDMISLGPSSAITAFLKDVAQHHGMRLTTRVQVNSFDTIAKLVSHNVGVAIIPQSLAEHYQQQLAVQVLSLDEAWAERKLVICSHRFDRLPGYARRFIELLLNQYPAAGEIIV